MRWGDAACERGDRPRIWRLRAAHLVEGDRAKALSSRQRDVKKNDFTSKQGRSNKGRDVPRLECNIWKIYNFQPKIKIFLFRNAITASTLD